MSFSNSRRLMIFTDDYPPHDRGGAGRIAYYHAKGFLDRGWIVGVVSSQESGRKISNTPRREEGITVYRLFHIHPFSRSQIPAMGDKALQLSTALVNPSMHAKLHRAVNEFSPDILHAHHIPRITYRAFSKVEPRLPRVLTFHTYHYECPKGGLFRKKKRSICEIKPLPCRIFQNVMKRELSSINRIIAISPFIEKRLLSAGYAPDRVSYIPNGVPNLTSRIFEPPSSNYELLYVGRIDHNKGLQSLIQAFEAVHNNSVRLTIVGDGPIRQDLEKAAMRDQRIQFVGWKNPAEVTAFYRRARVVIVPSIWHEVMNTVICEAQSWGRPVIATDVGSNAELVSNGQNGFIVPHTNSGVMTEKIITLLGNDATTDSFGRSAFNSVKRYSIETHLDKLEELYHNVVTG